MNISKLMDNERKCRVRITRSLISVLHSFREYCFALKISFKNELLDFAYTVLAGITFIIFISPIQSLYDKYLINKVLEKAHSDGYSSLIGSIITFVFLVIGISIIRKVWFLKIKLSKISTFAFLLSILAYYRFYDDRYSYYPLYEDFDSLNMLDLPYILLTTLFLILLKNKLSVKKISVKDKNYFFQDTAISSSGEDEFDRKSVFKGLVDSIDLISFDSNEGFVIGIDNEWGEGKTSFLNVLRKELDNSETILIDFNPWISSNSENISLDFFNTVDFALQKYVETETSLRNYASELHSIDSVFNPLKYFPGKWRKMKSYKEYIEEISDIIRKVNKKLVILIDDIDRLDNKEVFELLRTVRNSANFPRTLFIIPFHREYLIKAVADQGVHNPTQYISKIFQMEVSLPPISRTNLQAMLMRLFSVLLGKLPKSKEKDIQELEQQIKSLIYNRSTKHARIPKFDVVHKVLFGKFRNKRDLIRFYNNVAVNIYTNYQWVYLPDLFILETIKLLDSEIYHILNKSNDYLFTEKGTTFDKVYKKIEENKPSTFNVLTSSTTIFKIEDCITGKSNSKEILNLIDELLKEPELNEFNSKYAFSVVGSKENYVNYRENLLSIEAPQL